MQCNTLSKSKATTISSFSLDDDIEEKLEVTAVKLQRTKGGIINEALKHYIAWEDQKLRMLQET